MTRDTRDLTTLEYIVLGLISVEPQSGYSIVNYFDEDSYNSWSASPGSVYPMLKRLEKQGMIEGELEMEHETRPRKMYTLSEEGEAALDAWLREVPKMRPFYEQRELAMVRFQFMERRLSRDEVLVWINNYLDGVEYATRGSQFYQQGINKAMEESGQVSLHSQLAMEAYLLELNTVRTWLEMARVRLSLMPVQDINAQDVQERGA
jgi:DNA-binding PadR family transcriptional regulator